MLCLIYPQPYGSGLSAVVKCGFCSSRFLFPGNPAEALFLGGSIFSASVLSTHYPLFTTHWLPMYSANSCDVLHPVCLPGLAFVWRSGLLPVARCRSDVGPEEARPNSLPRNHILPIESAHAIVEASNHGRIHWCGWCPAVEPPDGPLLGLRVEGPHRDTAIGSTGNAEHCIVHIAVTPHKRLIRQRAFEFRPLVIVGEPLLQLSMMGLPLTNQEVEVVKTGDCTLCRFHPGARILVRLWGQRPRRCQAQT